MAGSEGVEFISSSIHALVTFGSLYLWSWGLSFHAVFIFTIMSLYPQKQHRAPGSPLEGSLHLFLWHCIPRPTHWPLPRKAHPCSPVYYPHIKVSTLNHICKVSFLLSAAQKLGQRHLGVSLCCIPNPKLSNENTNSSILFAWHQQLMSKFLYVNQNHLSSKPLTISWTVSLFVPSDRDHP